MTLTGKAIAGITTLGTVGGGIALANHLSSTKKPLGKTVSKALEKEGFDVNVENWGPILDAYNQLKDTSKTFKTRADETLTEKALQEKCKATLGGLSSNLINYRKARQWCVKEETIQNVLEKAKYKVLNTNQGDDKEWNKLAEDLRDAKDSFPNIGKQMTGNKDSDIAALKKGCTDLNISQLKTTAKDFDEKFELAKNWCAVKQDNV